MKILHTADLHLGQILYQNYERSDEHQHFFEQLNKWCKDEKPDVLLVCGDIFDIQQPSANTKKAFTEYFAALHRECPDIKIIITAGNHDSASRIHADREVWKFAHTDLIGISPALDASADCLDKYIVRLDSGYVISMPYMIGDRRSQLQSILDMVDAENVDGKPVVMTGHTAVSGLDVSGHPFDIGTLKTQDVASFGVGFDYLALGHIHKPQTIGHPDDAMSNEVTYSAPVVRYSGSALHVSCDEAYPHTVSLVEIDRHGGDVKIRQLRIDELRHFYVLPEDGAFASSDEALDAVRLFVSQGKTGYIRLRIDNRANLPSNFGQMIYEILAPTNEEVRYNPNILWEGKQDVAEENKERLTFEVAELQQMTDPMIFIEKTIDQYPGFDIDELRDAFEEVKKEVENMKEAEANSEKTRAKNKSN